MTIQKSMKQYAERKVEGTNACLPQHVCNHAPSTTNLSLILRLSLYVIFTLPLTAAGLMVVIVATVRALSAVSLMPDWLSCSFHSQASPVFTFHLQ